MPFSLENIAKYNNILQTDEQKEQWIAIANSTLERCLKEGKPQSECDTEAIELANSVLAAQKQQKPAGFREATGEKHCGNCQYFDKNLCWLYNYIVDADDVCDLYMPIFLTNYKR